MEPILRGRKRKYAEYDELLHNLPKVMKKRPRYINGVGVFRGARNLTAWIKISLPHGGVFQGKSYPKRGALEIKLGNLSSWSWSDLEEKYREIQGRADRGEALEDTQDILFRDSALYDATKPHVLRPVTGVELEEPNNT